MEILAEFMGYRIIQDTEACIGCGSCEAVCPQNWIMKEDKASPRARK